MMSLQERNISLYFLLYLLHILLCSYLFGYMTDCVNGEQHSMNSLDGTSLDCNLFANILLLSMFW